MRGVCKGFATGAGGYFAGDDSAKHPPLPLLRPEGKWDACERAIPARGCGQGAYVSALRRARADISRETIPRNIRPYRRRGRDEHALREGAERLGSAFSGEKGAGASGCPTREAGWPLWGPPGRAAQRGCVCCVLLGPEEKPGPWETNQKPRKTAGETPARLW